MKKVILMLAVACMLVAVFPVAGVRAEGICTEHSGDNGGKQNYKTWSNVVQSYLVSCDDGTLMRLQSGFSNMEGYSVEYYDASYQLIKAKEIPRELPIFGGFYKGKDAYFILTGQTNGEEDDRKEVFRITKYDKDWKRMASAGLYGANTTVPFDAGSARMDGYENYLVIRTCHEMYTSADGLNHQANVTIQLDMDTMQIVDSFTDVMNVSYGYVSHSFNQFVRMEDGKVVAVDHGDAHHRSIVLLKSPQDVQSGTFGRGGWDVVDLLEIPVNKGGHYNETGVSVGGFEISDTAYLVAGNMLDLEHSDNLGASTTRNIFTASLPKYSNSPVINQITNYVDGKTSTPQMVKLDADRFLLLWERSDGFVYYVELDGTGRQGGEVYRVEGKLSDCVPLALEEKVVWYTYQDNKVVFYEIDKRQISQNRTIEINNGHTYDLCKNLKNHIATLECSRCGKEKTVDTPEGIMVWWEAEDGWWHDSFQTSQIQAGKSLRYELLPAGREDYEDWEGYGDFILECSDPEAMYFSTEEVDSGWWGSRNKGIIRFEKAGTYILTIRHKYDGSVKKEITFAVSGPPEAVSLDTKKVTLNPKKTYSLMPELSPKEAVTTYIWTSSDKKVAKVKDGQVTAVAPGKATITVKTKNGKTASCTVVVKAAPKSVKLSKGSLMLKKGKSYQLKVVLTPAEAYTTYTWTSSNKKVATVGPTGKVKAVSKGTATITVKTANGKKATCKVTVQ